jgi:hypothetical protein
MNSRPFVTSSLVRTKSGCGIAGERTSSCAALMAE